MTTLFSLCDAPLRRKLRLLRAVALHLDALHRHDLVHGALSINEILVTDDDNVVLLNALTRAVQAGLSGPIFLESSLPPETFETQRLELAPAADVWSLGVIAYQLLTKVHPFVVRDLKPEERAYRATTAETDWNGLADELFGDEDVENVDDAGLAAGWRERVRLAVFVPPGQLVALPPAVARIVPRLLARIPGERPSAKAAAEAFSADESQ